MLVPPRIWALVLARLITAAFEALYRDCVHVSPEYVQ